MFYCCLTVTYLFTSLRCTFLDSVESWLPGCKQSQFPVVVALCECVHASGYDSKDCPGQVTYSVGQVKISVACPTRKVVISFVFRFSFFYWQYHISIQALVFKSLWQFLFCGSTITTSVSFYIIKPTDFNVIACDWLASAVKPIRS